MLRIGTLIAANVLLTVLTAAIVGPSVSKLHDQFGLVAWAARAPFYLLPLLLTPLTLWARPRVWQGVAAGFALGLPLALWARATVCPLPVQLAYVSSGALQGALLSRLARVARTR